MKPIRDSPEFGGIVHPVASTMRRAGVVGTDKCGHFGHFVNRCKWVPRLYTPRLAQFTRPTGVARPLQRFFSSLR